MTKPIDWTKPVRRISDGTPLRVLCTDKHGTYPVVCCTDFGVVETYTLDGRDHVNSKSKAVENIPPKKVQREAWTVGRYSKGGDFQIGGVFDNKADAENTCQMFYEWLHIVKLTWEEEDVTIGEPCNSCTGHIRKNNVERCSSCLPGCSQNFEQREDV